MSYASLILEQPWGKSEEIVRIFPPCEVRQSFNEGGAVTVFVKNRRSRDDAIWRQKRIGHWEFFPSLGFVAWDDKNEEYAWHVVGSIDVKAAKDPELTGKPVTTEIIRGESEALVAGAGSPKRQHKEQGRFMRWFLSKSRANDVPEFLRKEVSR